MIGDARALPFLLLLALLGTSPVSFDVSPPALEVHTWVTGAPGNPWTCQHLYDPATGAASFPAIILGGVDDDGALAMSDEQQRMARYMIEHEWYVGHQWHPGCVEAGA